MPHLLIVDDVPENAHFLGRFLQERCDCTVAFAYDGEAALEAVAEQPPTLILLDVRMPRLNGFEVCEVLKSDPQTAGIPVIFLTVKNEEEDIVKGLEVGAVDYVLKPVRHEVLLARVRTHLGIRANEERLREEGRNRANLLHILCHDIANPVAAIKGCVPMLKQEVTSAHGKDLLDLVALALDSADDLIEHVRQSLSVTEGKRQLDLRPWPLGQLVAESVAMLERRFEQKSVRLEVSVEDDGPVLTEHFSFINSILNNLLTNALKFSDPGTVVRVSSRPVGAMVELEVADEGIGMSARLCSEVFDFGSTTSRLGTHGERGTGYGLPLVKTFLDAAGGTIAVESKPRSAPTATDGYTRVRLQLPRV